MHAARQFLLWESTTSHLFGVLCGIDEFVEHPQIRKLPVNGLRDSLSSGKHFSEYFRLVFAAKVIPVVTLSGLRGTWFQSLNLRTAGRR